MNFRKYINRVYLLIKKANFIVLFMAYVVICTIIGIIYLNTNSLFYSDIIDRFVLGLPIILQLILTYIVHRENQEVRIIKILFIIVFLYTVVCGALSLYVLYFTYPIFVEDLIFYISLAQIIFQFVLAVLLLICLKAKHVDKLFIVKPLLMVIFTVMSLLIIQISIIAEVRIIGYLYFWMIVIVLFFNIFNPVLLYILSYTAKGKLFIKDNH